jgi:hypothetical protein
MPPQAYPPGYPQAAPRVYPAPAAIPAPVAAPKPTSTAIIPPAPLELNTQSNEQAPATSIDDPAIYAPTPSVNKVPQLDQRFIGNIEQNAQDLEFAPAGYFKGIADTKATQ